ncbi:MAG: MarR family winged helix-turn-helix transcriptional regulator [Actinobacteria bacterium]|nr:MarR family winged helix-turn-helix transcriptional regulator [Actinomycetota bacterium]
MAADDLVAVTDAVLRAAGVLAAVLARALAECGQDVTVPQFRALDALDHAAPLRLLALAELLGAQPSVATRLCDRLVAKDLMVRVRSDDDRREVSLDLTEAGAKLVRVVNASRRAEVHRILRRVPARQRQQMVAALDAFVGASRRGVQEPMAGVEFRS